MRLYEYYIPNAPRGRSAIGSFELSGDFHHLNHVAEKAAEHWDNSNPETKDAWPITIIVRGVRPDVQVRHTVKVSRIANVKYNVVP